ncbi:hypothetical protein QBC45DRAFT_162360 [Copromyces sp. CBS 386.78]|nr:hypothetical protein QBC45DRAFT_162360 [Copromyces sp. CBS 386.78]
MPGPRSTSHIKQYTPTQFSAAIAAVSSGSLSIRKAAQAHSIPFSTLQRHFQGTPQAKRSYETSSREMQKLAPEQEENIAMWVLAQENLGLPVKMEDIRRFADKVLEVGIKEAKAGQTPKGGAGRRKSAAGGTGTPAGKEGEAGGEGAEGSVTVGKHWGPKFMQRHPQLKAAREARRKELKKGLRGKQAVNSASAASVAATNTPTVINNPTPAATNGAANGQTGQTAPTSAPVAARFAPPPPPPQTPTPAAAAAAAGQRQRNGQKNGQQPQPQHQEHDDVDPELMEHDQDQTVIEDEEDQSVEDGEEDEEDDDDDESIVEVKDEEEYEDEQTPDQQLLMDSQRYSRFAVAVNGRRL